MTEKHTIALHACHDNTLIELDLTEQEAALLQRIARTSAETAEYTCMPFLTIRTGEIDQTTIDSDGDAQ